MTGVGPDPFGGLAVGTKDPGAGNGDRRRSKCAGQRACPPAMPVTGDRCPLILSRRPGTAPVARTGKCRLQFFLDHRLDEAAHFCPQFRLDRIEPIVEKPFGYFGRCLRGISFHGVISIGARTAIFFVETMRRLRQLPIPTTSATAPRVQRFFAKLLPRRAATKPFIRGSML